MITQKLEAFLLKIGISQPLLDLQVWNSSQALCGFGNFSSGESCRFLTAKDPEQSDRRCLFVYNADGILLTKTLY